jgi:hypothetical protein
MPDFRLKLRPPAAGAASDPVTGVIWITIAMALFAGLAVFSRMAMNAGLHPFEVVFLRNIFACVLLVPLLVYRGRSLLRSNKLGLYGVRVVISLLSMQAWFYAISSSPSARSPPSASWRRCSARSVRSSCSARRFGCGDGRRSASASSAPW